MILCPPLEFLTEYKDALNSLLPKLVSLEQEIKALGLKQELEGRAMQGKRSRNPSELQNLFPNSKSHDMKTVTRTIVKSCCFLSLDNPGRFSLS